MRTKTVGKTLETLPETCTLPVDRDYRASLPDIPRRTSQKGLSNESHDESMDGVQAYKLWRETTHMLTQYERRAREGKDLEAALSFARYVLWSGVVNVVNATAHLSPIAIDAAHLQWKAEDLQRTVQDFYRTGKAKPQIDLAEIEAINHKLDLIAGRIAQM